MGFAINTIRSSVVPALLFAVPFRSHAVMLTARDWDLAGNNPPKEMISNQFFNLI